jgi:hypothetical protein
MGAAIFTGFNFEFGLMILNSYSGPLGSQFGAKWVFRSFLEKN